MSSSLLVKPGLPAPLSSAAMPPDPFEFASDEGEFSPISALTSPVQERLAVDLVTVVRDSVPRPEPRHLQRPIESDAVMGRAAVP